MSTNQEQDMRVSVVFSLGTIVIVTMVLVLLYGWLGLVISALLVGAAVHGLVALANSGWFCREEF